jgi:hypothetical protein
VTSIFTLLTVLADGRFVPLSLMITTACLSKYSKLKMFVFNRLTSEIFNNPDVALIVMVINL